MEETAKRFTGAGPAVIFLLCWLAMPLGPLSWLGAITPLFLALYCWPRNKRWALFFGLANPLALTALLTVSGYFRGTAALHFHGLPGPQSFNLDRQTMLPRRGGGCVVNGSEWLGDGWNNFVLGRCVALFGPMKGSPSGPYPEEAALTGPWTDAERVKVEDLQRGRISVGGNSRSVPHGARLLEAYAPWAEDGQASPPDALWDDEEVAVRLQAKDFGGGTFGVRIGTRFYDEETVETTVLFAGEPTQIVGYFAVRGSSSSRGRFPPVRPGSR